MIFCFRFRNVPSKVSPFVKMSPCGSCRTTRCRSVLLINFKREQFSAREEQCRVQHSSRQPVKAPRRSCVLGRRYHWGAAASRLKTAPCGAILGDQFRPVAGSSSRMSEWLIPAPKAVICSGWRSQQCEGIPWMNCGLQNRRRVGSRVQVEDGGQSGPCCKITRLNEHL
jgi:hypothetical protein